MAGRLVLPARLSGVAEPPLAALEERSGLLYRRVILPAAFLDWYRDLFGRMDLLDPRRSLPGAVVISRRGPRTVFRFTGTWAPPPPTHEGVSRAGPLSPGVGGPGLVLKVEEYPFPSCLRGLLLEPRSTGEFRNLLALRSAGFPAVEPLACGWRGLGRICLRSFILMRDFEGSVSLKAWAGGEAPSLLKEELIPALGDLLGEAARLHARGWYVGTLYGKNILARRGRAGSIELRLCDVPRLRRARSQGMRFGPAAKDLACFDKWAREVLDASERRALLGAYLAALGDGSPASRWMDGIARRRDRMRHVTPTGRASRGLKRTLKRLHLRRFWPF